jgi:hypothetical protein
MTDAGHQTVETNVSTAAPTAIDTLRTRIAELERKLSEMGARRTFNRETRAKSGPPVNTSDKTALNDLRAEGLRLNLEEQDLEAWLATARAELAEAERQEVIAADVALAHRRLELADLLRQGGEALDSGFSAERFEGWVALMEALGATKLSCEASAPPPTGQQLRVFAVLAIKTMLQGVPLIAREFEAVAPKDRYTFAKLSNGWADASERTVRAFLEGAGVTLEAAE